MTVTRISKLTGKTHSLELPITATQMARYEQGQSFDDAFPNLTLIDRDFIRHGITPDEWNGFFLSPSKL